MLFIKMMMLMSILFMWMKHPLAMAIIIIIQTILVALSTGVMTNSFWFSYIIFIIMLSGMLVLFIYMASVASNEKFNISMKMFMLIVFMLSLTIPTKFMMNNMPPNYLNMMLNWLFNSKTLYITIIMVLYLFFTMIVVSKIVNINEGPLRTYK
uniref:NADH dehydrogenase subunit 6 n=1 Tax=Iphicrates gressitti TaxID=2969360 RepID=UPI002176A0DC|nr:NADH dehydrogenase subunit 6 [Iphicrates gressitti]UUJ37774.1 NADH dehydrogenase subunit 6 [Iphicrates gressitti]